MFGSFPALFGDDPALLFAILAGAVLTFLLTLVAVPWFVVRLPADYFAGEERPNTGKIEHPVLRILLLIGKNLFGVLFILMGLAMLVLPGQGLLTMVVGFLLLDFPGKYCLERWLVRRGPILRSVNWLRGKFRRNPLVFD